MRRLIHRGSLILFSKLLRKYSVGLGLRLTVLPSSHQVRSKLFGWLGVVLSERRMLSIFLHEPIDSVNANYDKKEQAEVTYSSNSGTSCWRSRKTRKLPSLAHAGWPIGSPSCPQTINLHFISLRVLRSTTVRTLTLILWLWAPFPRVVFHPSPQ